ncbi:MAG TPA: dGTPase, partial [Saprospiraceae bacterium]|nr:dGTPase [Saprospiraceae bacterium]
EAQLKDIITISVQKIYLSKEVVEKEIKGYGVLTNLLHVFTTAVNNEFEGKTTGFDKLVLALLPDEYRGVKESLYERLLSICSFVAGMSDRYAIWLNNKLT